MILQVDYSKLADKLGYKNARCAKDSYHRFRRTLIDSYSNGIGGGGGSSSNRVQKSTSKNPRPLDPHVRAQQKLGELDGYARYAQQQHQQVELEDDEVVVPGRPVIELDQVAERKPKKEELNLVDFVVLEDGHPLNPFVRQTPAIQEGREVDLTVIEDGPAIKVEVKGENEARTIVYEIL